MKTSRDQFAEILNAIEPDIPKESDHDKRDFLKSVSQTWPCFILADQGFWLFINDINNPDVSVVFVSNDTRSLL